MISKRQYSPDDALTLVRGARQLLTLRGPASPRRGAALAELGVIPDGALLLRGGSILEAGPSRRVENLAIARGALEVNAAGRVVMPGFIDAQTRPLFAPALAGRTLALRVRNMLSGMARHGTTTVAAGANAQQDPPDAWKVLRTLTEFDGHPMGIVPVCFAGIPAPQDSAAPEAYVEKLCTEVLPVMARRKFARFVNANAESMGQAAARRLLECARQLGFGIAVQAGARFAVEMEAASVALDPVEPAASDLARSGAVALLLPAAAYHRCADQRAAARAVIEAGTAVALASGFGDPHCPTYNMQMILSLACSQMGFSPAEAICAVTVNAAYALALGHRCGSLEPGKAADLLLLNVADYREVAEHVGVNHVHMVMKNGRVVYQEGEVTGWPSQ
jgi:imidazolonepropionase